MDVDVEREDAVTDADIHAMNVQTRGLYLSTNIHETS